MHMVAAAAKVARVKDAKRFIVVPGEGSGRDWTQTSTLSALGDDNISVLNVAKGTVLKQISRCWRRKPGGAKCLSPRPAGGSGHRHPRLQCRHRWLRPTRTREEGSHALLVLSSWVGYLHEARE